MPPEPKRPELTPAVRTHLQLARTLGRKVEKQRQAMIATAEQRQDAILWLLEAGFSEPALADELGVSRAVVQDAAEKARERRG